ncbi:fibronectin type III domain-containing protein [Granulicella arctica]|uniref:Fibronectin type-III domain-containing protein n=1 Tax=Granulicella arctica TaxID=940613 RepID=A0A7Y9TG81_9BACT|nr:fibronectin type III domain-containing protein [Granulicella arctica]NYF78460.1 hypothetical protein [Granulicella arctica]
MIPPANNRSALAKPIGISLLSLFLLASCASPGPPRPPSLHLPEIVSDLAAERQGDEVRLHWTTPAKTTDGLTITGTMTAQICRATPTTPIVSTVRHPEVCTPVGRVPAKAGPSEATDLLPPALANGPGELIEYRLELRNRNERSAGLSAPAFVAAGPAPPAVTGLHVVATEQGALLQWEPKDAADSIELTRLHAATLAKPAAGAKQPLQSAPKEPAEVHLRASKVNSADSLFRPDAGGTLDATAHRGETYGYTAERIRNVVIDGHSLQVRSAPSTSIKVIMRDTFPPKPPVGLETIVGSSASAPSIDLSWRPNTEQDLAGYLVYRRELGADGQVVGASVRLTATPIQEPGFSDTTIVAGHTYSYSVTAIDTLGNESRPSASAQEQVRLP